MALTLNGDGTIAGLAAGGLPDLSVGTGDIADAAITAAKMSGAQSGSAPAYAARAWVNFNGTSTVAIRASGNVSSITDNGTGDYTVNFTTAMPDADYSANISLSYDAANAGLIVNTFCSASTVTAPTTSSFRMGAVKRSDGSNADPTYVIASIFR